MGEFLGIPWLTAGLVLVLALGQCIVAWGRYNGTMRPWASTLRPWAMGQYIGGLGPDCVSPQPDLRTILLVHIDKKTKTMIPAPGSPTLTLILLPLPLYPYPYTYTLTLIPLPLPLCFSPYPYVFTLNLMPLPLYLIPLPLSLYFFPYPYTLLFFFRKKRTLTAHRVIIIRKSC